MIYGKIWCVVRPAVGIPIMLGAVAVGSFSVHYAILSHTTWLPKVPRGRHQGGKGSGRDDRAVHDGGAGGAIHRQALADASREQHGGPGLAARPARRCAMAPIALTETSAPP